MASQERITVYNLADLKNTSDDAIPNYLNSLKVSQSNTLIDVRLSLGYSAFLIAGACFLWDYKLGFDCTKHFTAAAVAIYTILNGALTLWLWTVERGTIYVGTTLSGDRISVATATRKNVPIYDLTITVTTKKSTKAEITTLSRPFTEWFDAAGHFVVAPFQTMLATSVPLMSSLDPIRAASAASNSSRVTNQDYSAEVLEALAASTPNSAMAGSARSVSTRNGGKRRKV